MTALSTFAIHFGYIFGLVLLAIIASLLAVIATQLDRLILAVKTGFGATNKVLRNINDDTIELVGK